MPNIDRSFLLVSLVALIAGMVFGFWMGATNNVQYLNVHVVLVLFGFVSLAIYGFIYRLWPAMKTSGLAMAQFWIAVVSMVLVVIGAWYQVANGSIAIIAPASLGAIVSALLLLWIFWTKAEVA